MKLVVQVELYCLMMLVDGGRCKLHETLKLRKEIDASLLEILN